MPYHTLRRWKDMTGWLILGALVLYAIFLVDKEELFETMVKGGWATAVFNFAIFYIIYLVVSTPEVVAKTVAH